jgi:hypothetical protein
MQTKQVNLSQILEDLKSGLTKWKKDDIGFGSIEKKYNLTITEAIKLFNHTKIIGIEHTIPTFVIIDDISEETIAPPMTIPEPLQAQPEVRQEMPSLKSIAEKIAIDQVEVAKLVQPVKQNLEVAF